MPGDDMLVLVVVIGKREEEGRETRTFSNMQKVWLYSDFHVPEHLVLFVFSWDIYMRMYIFIAMSFSGLVYSIFLISRHCTESGIQSLECLSFRCR